MITSIQFLGAPSLRMQLAMLMLAASGALVLILIIALGNPFRGDFRVSTAPFERKHCRGWKSRLNNNNSKRPCRVDELIQTKCRDPAHRTCCYAELTPRCSVESRSARERGLIQVL